MAKLELSFVDQNGHTNGVDHDGGKTWSAEKEKVKLSDVLAARYQFMLISMIVVRSYMLHTTICVLNQAKTLDHI